MSKSTAANIKLEAPTPMYDSDMSEEEYQAQSDCETLAMAYKIKKDKKRHSAAVKFAKKKAATLEEVVEDK